MRLSSRVFIALAIALMTGCHRRPPVVATPQPVATTPVPPPPVLTTETAIRKFTLGEYAAAAVDFEEYLKLVPSGGERDQALFYLGFIHALPADSIPDWQQAGNYLNQLIAEFPESRLKPVAQLILSLRAQITQLSSDVAHLKVESAQLHFEADKLRSDSSQQAEQIASLKKEAEQLTQDAARREEKIRQLNADLDRLIRIDSQPRPPRR